jgi:hypothetical protein
MPRSENVYIETVEAIKLQLVAQRAWKKATEFQIEGLSQLLASAKLMLSGIEAHEMALEMKLAAAKGPILTLSNGAVS